MQRPSPSRLHARGLLGLALVSIACAPIKSSSTVRIDPRPDAPTLLLGLPGGEVTARGAAVQWQQHGSELAVQVHEQRTCNIVRHVPMVRIETIERRAAGGALWFEYGFAAVALSVGLAGLIRPEAFSRPAINEDGESVRDPRPGIRIGAIFTSIAAVLTAVAVIDTVRTRDEQRFTDVYRREFGDSVQCRDPLVPLAGRSVELVVGTWDATGTTDDQGWVRFDLPRDAVLDADAQRTIVAHAQWARDHRPETDDASEADPPDADPPDADRHMQPSAPDRVHAPPPTEPDPSEDIAVVPPPPAAHLVSAVIRLGSKRAIAVDFVVPYSSDSATEHNGDGSIDPLPVAKVPPLPKSPTSDDRDGP